LITILHKQWIFQTCGSTATYFRTVARKFSTGGALRFCEWQLIYSVSCFNLGGRKALFWGAKPPKVPPPVATGLTYLLMLHQWCA